MRFVLLLAGGFVLLVEQEEGYVHVLLVRLSKCPRSRDQGCIKPTRPKELAA